MSSSLSLFVSAETHKLILSLPLSAETFNVVRLSPWCWNFQTQTFATAMSSVDRLMEYMVSSFALRNNQQKYSRGKP